MCNFFGTEAYATDLAWEGRTCYRHAPLVPWLLANGTQGGVVQAFGNLTRVVVAGAGHMSPFDQPASLHQLLYAWLANAFARPGQPCPS